MTSTYTVPSVEDVAQQINDTIDDLAFDVMVLTSPGSQRVLVGIKMPILNQFEWGDKIEVGDTFVHSMWGYSHVEMYVEGNGVNWIASGCSTPNTRESINHKEWRWLTPVGDEYPLGVILSQIQRMRNYKRKLSFTLHYC